MNLQETKTSKPQQSYFDCDSLKKGEWLGTLAPEQGGIYLGVWIPRNKLNNRSLGSVFDLYAARTDLKKPNGDNLLLTYNELIEYLPDLKDFHGHDGGGKLKNENDVLEAAKRDPYALTKWFVPPLTRLVTYGRGVDLVTLRAHKDWMPSGSELTTFHNSGHGNHNFYWSCTPSTSHNSDFYAVTFSILSNYHSCEADKSKFSTRLVRAVPRPSLQEKPVASRYLSL